MKTRVSCLFRPPIPGSQKGFMTTKRLVSRRCHSCSDLPGKSRKALPCFHRNIVPHTPRIVEWPVALLAGIFQEAAGCVSRDIGRDPPARDERLPNVTADEESGREGKGRKRKKKKTSGVLTHGTLAKGRHMR